MNFKIDTLLRQQIEQNLSIKIKKIQKLAGACTHEVYRFWDSHEMSYVLKTSPSPLTHIYKIEAQSLDYLRASSTVRVPKVYDVSEHSLVLEYIEPSSPAKLNLHDLYRLHEETRQPQLGLSFSTYLGVFLQDNNSEDLSWPDFYFHKRLKPLFQLCEQKKLVKNDLREAMEHLEKRIRDILPPLTDYSLLHGDLWSGNYFYDSSGKLVLIDPAIYFGHHECDLAMMLLFGGEESRLIRVTDSDMKQRIKIYQAYYLLYHLWFCGSSYYQATCESLNV